MISRHTLFSAIFLAVFVLASPVMVQANEHTIDLLLLDQDGKPVPNLHDLDCSCMGNATDGQGVLHIGGMGPGYRLHSKLQSRYLVAETQIVTEGGYDDYFQIPPGMVSIRQEGGARQLVPIAGGPYVIRAQRRAAPAMLIHFHPQYPYQIKVDGNAYRLNFRRAIQYAFGSGTDGDLRVSLRRVGDGAACEWRVEAINGGLQETQEVYPFTAPADGYVPVWKKIIDASSSDRTARSVSLYLKSRGGRMYGRLLLNAEFRDGNAELNVDGWFNPAGERNLEYDAFHRLEPDFDHPYTEAETQS